MERLAFGREGLAELAKVCAPVSKRDVLLEFRYCRKAEDFPFVGLAQQEPGQIVHMNALHDDHDRAGALIVKSRKQRIGEPLSLLQKSISATHFAFIRRCERPRLRSARAETA